MRYINLICTLTALSVLIVAANPPARAQTGPTVSVGYDFLPYQGFDEPITPDDSTSIDDGQARLRKMRVSLSYPAIFSKGRTILVNEVSYQLIDFRYHELTSSLERLHAASYSLMLQHRLSEKWSALAAVTPALASDLEADVSSADFSFQAAAVFIRQFSERFALGLGAAYSTQFGSAVPLPVITLDWNNGKNLVAKAILPASLEFWYTPGKRVDVGIWMLGDGNNFRLDPVTYDATDPELRYTMLTIGPAAKIHLTERLHLNIEAGVIGLHRFEFYDGDDEGPSYDLSPSQYIRLGLQSSLW